MAGTEDVVSIDCVWTPLMQRARFATVRRWLAALCLVAHAAAAASEADLWYQQGVALGKSGDFRAALPLIRQAADAGHAQAQYTLGGMYAFGQGVVASRTEARLWYERAAAQHHPSALYNLGLYHDRGLGVAVNRPLALMYYKLGAHAGDGQSAYNAGHLLVLGEGVPADAREGMRYLEIAANLRIGQGQMALGYVHERALGVPRDIEAALTWYARAEANGMEQATDLRIALTRRLTEEGLAVERDGQPRVALALFDLACEFDERSSCYNAGRLRYTGRAVPRDLPRALPDLRKACRWDIPPACMGMVGLLIQGQAITSDDLALTRKYISETCELGDQQSCYYYAWMKLQPALGMVDGEGAQRLLAQACFNHGFDAACQPYMNLYNASLPQTPASREMNPLEKGAIALLEAFAGTMAGLGAAAQASNGSYSGASSYSPPAYSAPAGGYSIQDNADFQQFIQSVSAYGTPGNCRAGNPYC